MQYKAFNFLSFAKSKYANNLSEQELKELELVSHILPFKVNNYILDELIDWNNKETDPMFNLYFFNKHMLHSVQLDLLQNSYFNTKTIADKNEIIKQIRAELNPHPAKQMTANVPLLNNKRVNGLQHKYKETCLIFPKSGQTCHSYCTFCFRWAQFIGDDDQKFYTDSSGNHIEYIKQHKEITDLLFTGGDPMIMSVAKIKENITPFLSKEFAHIQNIRIGTKSIVNFPYKYINDKETPELLLLFENIVKSGKHLSIMAHINHWIEMESEAFITAVNNIRNTGAEIRTQSPILNNINDSSQVWSRMWKEQVKLGLIPYYMFIERETGAEKYFNI
ncbi:MAG TPA: lysine 2,3-aminomutase, partial [Melioribacteraceae bacterium]|nr:lysine 2,3-aminomutase [Melioribacteraceae bacterium]